MDAVCSKLGSYSIQCKTVQLPGRRRKGQGQDPNERHNSIPVKSLMCFITASADHQVLHAGPCLTMQCLNLGRLLKVFTSSLMVCVVDVVSTFCCELLVGLIVALE